MRWLYSDDKAVSETLGYILIFTIVLTCIAFILLTGNGVLSNAKSQNNFKSMEQGLSVLNSDLKQVALEGSPVKTTRIHMEGGSISAHNDTNMLTVVFNGNTYYHRDTGNISFRSDSDPSVVSIENGGLWEKKDFNSTDMVVLKPRIFNITSSNTLVLNVIRLNATDASIAGSTTLDISLRDQGSNAPIIPDAASPMDVTITFETAYPRAWARFFEENGAELVAGSLSANSLQVKFHDIKKLVISEHVVGATVG